jgi:hypothetical protein
MEEYTMHARMVEFMRREDPGPVQAKMMDDFPSSTPQPIRATTTTTRLGICMATKADGSQCTMLAKPGFLTCWYKTHRAQEEELKKKAVPVPRVDSNASTATNAQAPPPTQPSVAQLTRKGSRLKPPGATKKRKRGGGDDEEELEHNHLPGETREDCRACAAGCGELTQPTISPILHSEQADRLEQLRHDYFSSPEPEVRILHGLPPSPTLNGPSLPSPTSMEADRLEAEQTGFRTQGTQDEVMRALTTTAFFRDPGHYISDTRARAMRACEAAAKRKADEEEAKRKAEECGDMSGARKKIKDRCNRIQMTANVKRAMKFHKDRFRL